MTDVCIKPKSRIFYECSGLLVWKHASKEPGVQHYPVLHMVLSDSNNFAYLSFMALTVGSQSAGQFLYIVLCALVLSNSSFAPDISKARTSAIKVNRLMERVPQIDSWSAKGKRIDKLEQGHLIFKDVHFRYPSRYYYLL
jgi:hypothetical protein